ncbi:MAG: hypothetical protein UT34_C0001G0346 [candidate division WS6 bacterium GW2011_GWF2_39_15]|uniref:Uncharacterized protein n=1 Tax=candidate division WS6 bacterium GW2011_GWF2_39_15 TaxID=1619100 RepID=A0A0G0N0F0_9BACT|nr:MAG: hypothetical protein UT34_C0001G0346 [candidate division WS6 bacterium GW2011_GWF2_39_15]
MNQALESVQNFFLGVGFIPILVVLAVLGIYIFWAEAHATRKDRNSIFDLYIIAFIITIIWGRVSYILANPADFQGLIWSIVPYEKYSDGIYYFRLLPWKFLKIWDGGFLYISMYVAFTTITFALSTFVKKWRWREMLGVISISGSIMLGLSLFATGLYGENVQVRNQGLGIIGIFVIYSVLHYLLKKALKNNRDSYEKNIFILHFAYFVIANIYILFSLLSSEITKIDRYNLYALAVFCLLSSILYIYDMQKTNIVVDTVIKAPRLPKIGSAVRISKGKK